MRLHVPNSVSNVPLKLIQLHAVQVKEIILCKEHNILFYVLRKQCALNVYHIPLISIAVLQFILHTYVECLTTCLLKSLLLCDPCYIKCIYCYLQ